VYRGCAIPDLDGAYFFADYCTDQIWTIDASVEGLNLIDRTDELAPGDGLSIGSISSFGRDAAGEIYICDRNDGEVFKIVPAISPQLASTDPPNDAIDARRSVAPNGVDPVGWKSVDLQLDIEPLCYTIKDFSVSVVGSENPPPVVDSVASVGDARARVTFDRVIDTVAWTRVYHHESGADVRIGALPGDVDGSRTSSPTDILALIDDLILSGGPKPAPQLRPMRSTDIDRSGDVDSDDVVLLIALLDGSEGPDVYLGATLP
jgi:hypothetical protein